MEINWLNEKPKKAFVLAGSPVERAVHSLGTCNVGISSA
jgi:hypothetical protein